MEIERAYVLQQRTNVETVSKVEVKQAQKMLNIKID